MREQFIARATELGATVRVAAGPAEAASLVESLCLEAGAVQVALSETLGRYWEAMAVAVGRSGASLVESRDLEDLAQVDLGVGRAVLGLAETGSVVMAENGSQPKLVAMLPPALVILLDLHDLVPGLDQVGDYLRKATLGAEGPESRYITLISGPSRTSDVEKTLTIGVHGPGRLQIVLVGPSPDDSAGHTP